MDWRIGSSQATPSAARRIRGGKPGGHQDAVQLGNRRPTGVAGGEHLGQQRHKEAKNGRGGVEAQAAITPRRRFDAVRIATIWAVEPLGTVA
jgi:hypothetical protein